MLEKKKGIKASLHAYMQNATIDLMGYQKKVSENLANYFSYAAALHGCNPSDLTVEIGFCRNEAQARLMQDSIELSVLPTETLIDFFVGKEVTTGLGLAAKIERRVNDYLLLLAKENGIDHGAINLKIQVHSGDARVFLGENEKYLRLIPLKTIIKHFKP